MGTTTRNGGTIPLTVFDIHAVSRVTGLSVPQLQRWDRTGFLHPSLADPNRRRPGSRIYVKSDVLTLAAIARMRAAGVPMRQIEPVLPLLAPDREEHGEWPARAFHIAANRVYLSQDEATEAANRAGQVRPVTIDLASVAVDVDEAIARLPECLPEEIGQVMRRRAIMSGVPIIAGTRIPTETIAWFHDNGYTLDWVLENYPRLTPE
ncbi:MAG: DUF433 domain-containing protein, partial [Thermomicrobiales bacterium]